MLSQANVLPFDHTHLSGARQAPPPGITSRPGYAHVTDMDLSKLKDLKSAPAGAQEAAVGDRPRIYMSSKTQRVVVVFPNGEVVEGKRTLSSLGIGRMSSFLTNFLSGRDLRVGSKFGQMAPNGTNLELFKISFQNILARLLKSPRLFHLG